jgi:hypothetical protein
MKAVSRTLLNEPAPVTASPAGAASDNRRPEVCLLSARIMPTLYCRRARLPVVYLLMRHNSEVGIMHGLVQRCGVVLFSAREKLARWQSHSIGNRAVERLWDYSDVLGLMQQLGIDPWQGKG